MAESKLALDAVECVDGASPEGEVAAAALDLCHAHLRRPVAVWELDGAGGAMRFASSRGLTSVQVAAIEGRIGRIPCWRSLAGPERAAIMERLAELAGGRRADTPVAAIDADPWLFLVVGVGPDVERDLRLLTDVMPWALRHVGPAAEAHQRSAELEQALAWVAHEFRAPLLGVGAALERGLRLEEAHPEILERCLRTVRQLSAEVGSMLEFGIGRRRLRLETVDLLGLVWEAADRVSEDGERRRVRIDGPAGVEVRADRTHLIAAVGNLIRNALDYSVPGGRITVRVRPQGDSAVVTVSNRGAGVLSADAERIFEPFAHGARSTPGYGRGVGMGLFIARRVVEAHGGRLGIDSSGTRTTFRVELRRGGGR